MFPLFGAWQTAYNQTVTHGHDHHRRDRLGHRNRRRGARVP